MQSEALASGCFHWRKPKKFSNIKKEPSSPVLCSRYSAKVAIKDLSDTHGNTLV